MAMNPEDMSRPVPGVCGTQRTEVGYEFHVYDELGRRVIVSPRSYETSELAREAYRHALRTIFRDPQISFITPRRVRILMPWRWCKTIKAPLFGKLKVEDDCA